jgi:hypothetical protein
LVTPVEYRARCRIHLWSSLAAIEPPGKGRVGAREAVNPNGGHWLVDMHSASPAFPSNVASACQARRFAIVSRAKEPPMSFNFSFTAPDKAAAKSELAQRNEESGNHMPDDVEDAVSGLIDAMPDPAEGHQFNVATYGHVDTTGQSNITVSVQHVVG